MRYFIFTKRDREVLESVMDGSFNGSDPKDKMLLSVLKKRISEYYPVLVEDFGLLEKIVEKLDLGCKE